MYPLSTCKICLGVKKIYFFRIINNVYEIPSIIQTKFIDEIDYWKYFITYSSENKTKLNNHDSGDTNQ